MTLTPAEISALFDEVRAEWNEAEEIVKSAEQICAEAVFPSIKELRYAGRRLVDSFHEMANGGDRVVIEGFVKDAVFNCHCARHDAIDVATATIATNLELVVSKIGYDHVLRAFPEFAELRRRLTEVRGKIRHSRSNRIDRNAIYNSIHDADLPGLATLYDHFQAAEPIMKGLAATQRREQVFLRATTIVSIVVAIVAVLFSAFKPPDCPTISLPPGAIITVPSSPPANTKGPKADISRTEKSS